MKIHFISILLLSLIFLPTQGYGVWNCKEFAALNPQDLVGVDHAPNTGITREKSLSELNGEAFDIVIVGGGAAGT